MRGNRWKKVLETLEKLFDLITKSSKKHLVSILNFSKNANFIVKYKMEPSKKDLSNLTFLNNKSNYNDAFVKVISLIKENNQDIDLNTILMTAGEGSFPENSLNELNKLISEKKSIHSFKFFVIGFYEELDEDFWSFFGYKYTNKNTVERIAKTLGAQLDTIKEENDLINKSSEIIQNSMNN